MNPTPVKSQAKHLIIAGVTRAGTTSLYNYLGDHPKVCASTIKETRFFMDTDGLRRLHRYEDGPGLYDKFFTGCPADAVRLEATPDYVYCLTAARRISDTLTDAHIVVILREPIDRLISWRRYAIQNGLLDPETSLTEYIKTQFDADDTTENNPLPQYQRALREGRYSHYLPAWIEAFGSDRLTVIPYNDLLTDPVGVTHQLCDCAGIDGAFYDSYEFTIHNESRPVRWPKVHSAYRSLIWRVKPYIHDKPATRSLLRRVRRTTDAALGRTGKAISASPTTTGKDELTARDRQRLEIYYQDEPTQLADLLGLPDWRW